MFLEDLYKKTFEVDLEKMLGINLETANFQSQIKTISILPFRPKENCKIKKELF